MAALISFAYSIYIDANFTGLNDIYFFEYYNRIGLFAEHNVIRGDTIRYYGLAGSNLTMSQLLLIPLSYAFAVMNGKRKRIEQLFSFFLFCLLLSFLILTQARNSLLAFTMGISFLVIEKMVGIKSKSFFLFMFLYFFSFLLVLFINSAGYGDLSSIHRVVLFSDFIGSFFNKPFGYGIGTAGIAIPGYQKFFESSISTVLTDIGFVGLFYFYFYLFKIVEDLKNTDCERTGLRLAIVSLLFLTNFSNIFDNSLFLFSFLIILGLEKIKTNFIL